MSDADVATIWWAIGSVAFMAAIVFAVWLVVINVDQ